MTVEELLADEKFWRCQKNELEAHLVDLMPPDAVPGQPGLERADLAVRLFLQHFRGQIQGNLDWEAAGKPAYRSPEWHRWRKEKYGIQWGNP